eukprot:COSAG02_NODE_10501_length_1928_cov_0.822854_2_plen_117_part_00
MEAADEVVKANAAPSSDLEMDLRHQMTELQVKLKEQEREAKEREDEIRDEEQAKAAKAVAEVREELLKLQDVEHQDALKQQHKAEIKRVKLALVKQNRSYVPRTARTVPAVLHSRR